jgi:PAS domain S-box-containing protein
VKQDKQPYVETVELRRRAEERLGEKSGSALPHVSEEEPQRLIHELQVHQIELEMQNAELRQTREDLEVSLDRYTSLYDFAPVGYVSLDRNGTICSCNLTGAALLGIERAQLLNRRFHHLVAETDFSSFTAFLDSMFDDHGKHTCEVILLKEGGHQLRVRIEAVADESRKECRLALIDISVQKQLQEEVALKMHQLESVLALVKQLEGVIPICSYCKKIRDDKGSWHQLEKYITEHSEAFFNHGVCEECYENALSDVLKLK